MHHRHSRGNVTRSGAVVYKSFARARGIPVAHRVRTDFHFECRRHSVTRLETVILIGLPVRMQIYEARRNHKTSCFDGCLACEWSG